MKFLDKSQSRILFHFLLNYIVIVLVVSVFFYPVYNISVNTVKENAMQDTVKSLENGVRILEHELRRLQDMATALRNERSFSSLVNLSSEEITSEDYYMMYTAKQFMRKIMLPSDITYNSFYLYKKNDILISRDIIAVDRKETYGKYFEEVGKGWDEWIEYIFDFTIGNKRNFKEEKAYKLWNNDRCCVAKKHHSICITSFQRGILFCRWGLCITAGY